MKHTTVIDFHTHIFPDALAPRALARLTEAARGLYEPVTDMTAAGLLRFMEAHGIDVSVVQPVVTKPSQTAHTNAWAASLQSDRLIAFGGLHPDTDDYRRDIDQMVALGLRGIKLHPEYQGFTVDEPRMLPIYEYALARGLILLFHAGFDPAYPPPFHSSPARFARVARAMQGGVLIAAHLGGHAQWDDVERYLPGTGIYLDTSMGFQYVGSAQFLRIAEAMGADHLLFASDSPWSHAGDEMARLRALPLPDDVIGQILGGNAGRILRIAP